MFSSVLLTACGGGGPTDTTPSEPSAEPSAGPSTVATATPEPDATPTLSLPPKVVLAIGGTLDAELPDGRTGTYPRILRWTGETWSQSLLSEEVVRELQLPPRYDGFNGGKIMLLSRVIWQSAQVVWIVAHGGDSLGLGNRVLRSSDRGVTWVEASHLLPEIFRYRAERDVAPQLTVDDVWFEDTDTWWVAGGYRSGVAEVAIGPTVWRTDDAGTTWVPVVRLGEALGPGVFFGRSTNQPDLTYVRHDTENDRYETVHLPLDMPGGRQQTTPRLFTRAYARFDDRRWAVPWTEGGGVWTSLDGQEWSEQEIEGVPPAGTTPGEGPQFFSIDFTNASTGVICGGTDDILGVPRRPYCAYTTSGGDPWFETTFSDTGVQAIVDVALLDESHGWGIGRIWSGGGIGTTLVSEFRMFETLDGGATFEHVPTPFDEEMALFELAATP